MNHTSMTYGTQTGMPALAFGLRDVTDWTVQQPFLDVFKTARPWTGHTESEWGAYDAEALSEMGILDENGWITRVPDEIDRIEAFILTEIPVEADYTAGRYRLTYDGDGDLDVIGPDIVSRSDGEIWFDYDPRDTGIVAIAISSTDPQGSGDYLRNFEIVEESRIEAYEGGQFFNPLWLDVIEDAHSLRFMDWQETNNSDLEAWSDRQQVTDYTYHKRAPLEIMVALANDTGTEPWFNIPFKANETFIREFATYVRDNLDPDLRAHFELSNEVWNWTFDQADDAAAAAKERFGEDLGDGWMQEYGARAAEMAETLDQVFDGSEDQLVKVISTQTSWTGLETAVLEAPAWQALDPDENSAPYLSFDTYAITGYFGASLGTDEKANDVLAWIDEGEAQARAEADADGLSGAARDDYISEHRFDLAEENAAQEIRDGSITGNGKDSLKDLFELFDYHKSVADEHGLDLVTYEAGTHVVGTGEWVNNETLTEFFTHFNYSEEMGNLYQELLDGWEDAGGTLFNAFVDVSEPTKFGSWGSLRHLEDSSARHDAIEGFIQEYPAPESMKDGDNDPEETTPPNEGEDDTNDGQTDGDIVQLDGQQSDYTIRLSNEMVVVVDRKNPSDEMDISDDDIRLVFEENLEEFNPDGMLLDEYKGVADLEGQELVSLTELYIAYFNRAPDAIGLHYWGSRFADGLTLEQIAEEFSTSAEAQSALPPGIMTQEFVETVYDNVLGRSADGDGLTYWADKLESGSLTRDSFILQVLEGAKSDLKPELGESFVAQQVADRAYLEDRIDIGTYFAVIKGMSDVDDASEVMTLFDGTEDTATDALAAIDTSYADASDPETGEFLMPLVGVLDESSVIG